MSLHLSHCRERWPTFESGHLGVHSTWGIKHRVPLTYLFLMEGSSWGACEKLAYLFNRRQGINLIPRWYGVHGTFLTLLYWNWWSSILETVVSEILSSFKGRQTTFSVWCGSRDGYGANAREIALISIWFGVHRTILHSCGDMSFLLVMWKFVGDSLEFSQANCGSLRVWLGKCNCSGYKAGESSPIWWRGGSLMGFLELRQGPMVYSRGMVGMSIRNWTLFSEVRKHV